MRINLTKKEIVNSIYMQLGFSKRLLDLLLEDILKIIVDNLKQNKKVKISNFGTFEIRYKKEREGRNPKTKVQHTIEPRYTVKFIASNTLKKKS